MARCGARISILPLCAVVFLVAVGCREAGPPLDEVTVQFLWYHSAQFAGFYAAEQNGYYAEEGLDVTLVPIPEGDAIAPVADGTADFGIGPGVGLVSARARGEPVVAIACIYRRYPLVFMTLASSGITRPHDFPGHTIRELFPGSSAIVFPAMMSRLGLDPDSVREVDVGFDIEAFLAREADIWPTYLTTGVAEARSAGNEVNVILPEDYGLHLYGDTLFTSDRLIRENPDLVLRFVRATLRGWRWAVENAKEAGRLSLEYDPTLDAEHQVAQMEASLPLIHTGEDQIGWMRAEVWQTTHDILREQGVRAGPVDIDRIYTMEFLHEIYGGPEQ